MGDDTNIAGGGPVTSPFVLDNIPEEMSYDSPLWEDIPTAGQLSYGDGGRLTFRVAHDILALYLRIEALDQPGADRLCGRTSALGHLYLDDCIELSLAPAWTPNERWLARINAAGAVEWVTPSGASVAPSARVELDVDGVAWRLFAAIPFIDLFNGGDVARTPIEGEKWGFNIGRILPRSDSGGARLIAGGDALSPSSMGTMEFFGGPTKVRVKLDGYEAPTFGVNTVKFDAETSVRDGALAGMEPAPAGRLRTRTKAHMRFRVAKPGTYRIWVDVAEEPAPEVELDIDEELREEDAEPQEPARGESACRAGVTFVLQDIWSNLERMENHVEGLKERLADAGIEAPPELAASLGFFEGTLIRIDRFRSPNVKESLTADLWQQFETLYQKSVSGMRALLIGAGLLTVVSPYAEGGEWYKTAVHSEQGDRSASDIVQSYRNAGYRVLCLIRPLGSPLASEAEVSDIVCLPGVEAGEHAGFIAIGPRVPQLSPGEYSYALIARNAVAGGVSFLAATEKDTFPLPPEAKDLVGLGGNMRLWDRYLAEINPRMWFIHSADSSAVPGTQGAKERFNVILAKDLSVEGVLAAFRAGSFYASTGPIIEAAHVSGATITVRSKDPAHITFVGKGGEVLSGAMGTEASYTFNGQQQYVRASVLADVDADGFRREALTQPFTLSPDVPSEEAQVSRPTTADELADDEEAAPAPERDPSLPVGAVTAVLDDFIEDDEEETADPGPATPPDDNASPPGEEAPPPA